MRAFAAWLLALSVISILATTGYSQKAAAWPGIIDCPQQVCVH